VRPRHCDDRVAVLVLCSGGVFSVGLVNHPLPAIFTEGSSSSVITDVVENCEVESFMETATFWTCP